MRTHRCVCNEMYVHATHMQHTYMTHTFQAEHALQSAKSATKRDPRTKKTHEAATLEPAQRGEDGTLETHRDTHEGTSERERHTHEGALKGPTHSSNLMHSSERARGKQPQSI